MYTADRHLRPRANRRNVDFSQDREADRPFWPRLRSLDRLDALIPGRFGRLGEMGPISACRFLDRPPVPRHRRGYVLDPT